MENDILHELILIMNYIGDHIDDKQPVTTDVLNELWHWLDSLVGRSQ